MSEIDALIGQTLAHRYHLDALIGQGGMGAVFRATHVAQHLPVALKVILPGAQHQRLLPRFLREARLSSRLEHPHVVRVLDFGRFGNAPEPRAFLVMELVDGLPLDALLERDILPLPVLSSLMHQILAALAHVHARGVLHRDIKPDNILVSRDPTSGLLTARLTDFGLAAALADEDNDATRLTQDGGILGTPAYMAPEQAEGRPPYGPPVDLYPIGVMLYRGATGQLPFKGTLTQLLLQKITRDPPPITSQDLDPHLEATIHKLLARRPEDRFPLAADALTALEPHLASHHLSDDLWHLARGDAHVAQGADPTLFAEDLTQALPVELCRCENPFWGRRDMFERLNTHALDVESGAGRIVAVLGPPGIGKTTLCEHAARHLNETGRFLRMSALSTPDGDVLSGLRAAAHEHLGTVGQTAAASEAAISAHLQRFQADDTRERQEILLLLHPETTGLQGDPRPRAYAAFVRMLRRLTSTRPLLLLLDDLSDDAETSSFLDLLLFEQELEPFPLLVLIPMRAPRSHPLVRTLERITALELGPLPTEVLARGLERLHNLSPRVAEGIAQRSHGNPLFALHLARTRSNFSSLDHGSSQLPGRLQDLLERSLEDRLARLPDPERAERVLEHMAILGERVDVELLTLFLGPESQSWLDDVLDALIDEELLLDLSLETVAFANGLLREAVLAGIGKRKTRRLHTRAAEVRASHTSPDDAGAIGDHWAAAEQPQRAIDAWKQALELAQQRSDNRDITRYGEKLLHALPKDDPRRSLIAVTTGRALRADAELAAAQTTLEPLLEHPDADVALQAGEILAEVFQELAKRDAWRSTVERMRARVPSASPIGTHAFLRAQAFLFNTSLRYEEAIHVAEQALDSPDPDGAQTAANRLTWSYICLNRVDRALEIANNALQRAVEANRLDLQAEALRLLALALTQQGDAQRLREVAERGLELHRRAGRMARFTAALNDYAMSLLLTDQPQAALERTHEALRLAQRLDMPLEWARATLFAVHAHVALDQIEQARHHLEHPAILDHVGKTYIFTLTHIRVLIRESRIDEATHVLDSVDIDTLPRSLLFRALFHEIGTSLRDAGAPRGQALLDHLVQ